MVGLLSLPIDPLLHIVDFLVPADRCAVPQVCRATRDASRDNWSRWWRGTVIKQCFAHDLDIVKFFRRLVPAEGWPAGFGEAMMPDNHTTVADVESFAQQLEGMVEYVRTSPGRRLMDKEVMDVETFGNVPQRLYDIVLRALDVTAPRVHTLCITLPDPEEELELRMSQDMFAEVERMTVRVHNREELAPVSMVGYPPRLRDFCVHVGTEDEDDDDISFGLHFDPLPPTVTSFHAINNDFLYPLGHYVHGAPLRELVLDGCQVESDLFYGAHCLDTIESVRIVNSTYNFEHLAPLAALRSLDWFQMEWGENPRRFSSAPPVEDTQDEQVLDLTRFPELQHLSLLGTSDFVFEGRDQVDHLKRHLTSLVTNNPYIFNDMTFDASWVALRSLAIAVSPENVPRVIVGAMPRLRELRISGSFRRHLVVPDMFDPRMFPDMRKLTLQAMILAHGDAVHPAEPWRELSDDLEVHLNAVDVTSQAFDLSVLDRFFVVIDDEL